MHVRRRLAQTTAGSLLLLAALLLCAISSALGVQAQPFRSPVLVPTGNDPVAIYSADFNGDGIPDLLVIDAGATPDASTARVLLGDGKGGFKQSAVLSVGGTSVGIGDFNSDGKLDVAWLTAVATPANLVTTVHLAPGNGDGTFGAPSQHDNLYTYTSAQGYSQGPQVWKYLQAVQVAATGPPDLIAEESHYGFCSEFAVVAMTGGLKCQDLTSIGVGPVAVADLDRDGHPDLLITGVASQTTNTVLYRSGSKSYAPGITVGQVLNTESVLPRDMDGDGIPDLVAADSTGRINIYHGYGDGTFATASEIGSGANDASTGRGGHLIGVADLDGDGILDLVTATPLGISVLLGQGGLSYTLGGIYNAGPGRGSFVLADFDRDGHLDLAVDNPQGVEILFGKADGSFGTAFALTGALTANPEPSPYLHSFTLTATLTTTASAPAPTGSVTFSVDGAPVGTSPVSGGSASFTDAYPLLSVGSHAISATYTGDANYSSLTLTGTHGVSLLPSYTYLTNLVTIYHYGETIASTSIVHADPANPTVDFESTNGGSIYVFEDGVKVCTLLLSSAGSSCPPSTGSGYSAGVHTIYLQYTGNQYYAPSTSVTYSVTILPDDTTTSLASSMNPAPAGTAVAFTATVASGYLIPPGGVTFYDGGSPMGTASLNNAGVATWTTSTLSPGTHNITATYGATQNFNASTSSTVAQVITAGAYGFTMTVTPSTLSVPIGSSVSVLLSVGESGGFSQPVALSCSGLVTEATCSFGSATIPAGGGNTRLTVSAAAPHTCGTDTPYFVASGYTTGLEALGAGLLIFLVRRRRRVLRGVVLALLLGVLPALSGCGNCTDLGVRPGTYTFTVTGTSTGSPAASISQTLQMNAHL